MDCELGDSDNSTSRQCLSENNENFKSDNYLYRKQTSETPSVIYSRHFSSRQVKFIVVSFGIRLLVTAIIWDHFVHKYQDLLMNLSDNELKRVR